MALSPEKRALLDQLNAELGPIGATAPIEPSTPPGERAWRNLANIPHTAAVDIGRGVVNLAGAFQGAPDEVTEDRRKGWEQWMSGAHLRVEPPKGQPEGALGVAADVGPMLIKELALLAAPQSKLTAGAKLLGLGEKGARIAGAVGTGALSGIRHSGEESAIQSGEFGVGQALAELIPGGGVRRELMKAATQAAVPFVGQVVRGKDPFTKETGVQAAVQAILGSRLVPEAARAVRKFGEKPPPPPIQTPPKRFQPSPGLAAELGLDVPTAPASASISTVDDDLFDLTFGGRVKDSSVRVSGPPTPRDVEESFLTPDEAAVIGVPSNAEPLMAPDAPVKINTKSEPLGWGRPLIQKKTEAPSNLVMRGAVDKKKALEQSMAVAENDLAIARATGDEEGVMAAEGAMRVIRKALAQQGSEPKKFKLRKSDESGIVSAPLLMAAGRTAIGGAVGGTIGDTPEERMRNAALFAGGAMLGPAAAKKAFGLAKVAMESAARRETFATGQGSSALGRTTRFLEEYFNLNQKPETKLAMEKGKGTMAYLQNEYQRTLNTAGKAIHAATNDTALRPHVDDFLNSHGRPADVAKLNASPLSDEVKNGLRNVLALKRQAQLELLNGEKDTARRAVIASTLGIHKSNTYEIDIAPWKLDESKLPAVIDQFQNGPLRGFDRRTIEMGIRQDLMERSKANDPFLTASGRGIKSTTLYTPKMDLTPSQWEMLDNISSDPALPAGAGPVLKQFVTDKTITPAEQHFLRALSQAPHLGDDVKSALREMADKKILTKEYKELLGYIDNPIEREIYTMQKLLGSVAQAKTIAEIADTVLPNGARLAYTETPGLPGVAGAAEKPAIPAAMNWSAAIDDAIRNGDTARARELEGYVQLESGPKMGKLAGAYVPRDVRDALYQTQEMSKGVARMFAHANSWVKEAATAWNPSTQVRQIAQTPLFMMAARVGPREVAEAIDLLVQDSTVGGMIGRRVNTALWKEIRQQHISGANYSHSELKAFQQKLNRGGGNIFKRAAKGARDAVLGAYGLPDDLVRISAYLSAKARFNKKAAATGLTGAAAEQWVRDKATTWVNDHTMNYGAVPKIVKSLRNVPFVSPFISYSAEITRLTKNLLKDVALGEAGDRIWAAAALSAWYAGPVALAAWGREKFLKPEQREEWDYQEQLMPVSTRGTLKMPVGVNKKGSYEYVNLNPHMPAADMVSMVRSAAKGDWESAALQQPFFGVNKNPMLSAAVDAFVTGEHNFTHEKLDEPMEKVGRIGEAVLPSWAPGGFLFKRGEKSFVMNDDGQRGQIDPRTGAEYTPKTFLQSAVGGGVRTSNTGMLERSFFFQLDRKLRDAKQEANRVLQSGAPSSQKEEAIRRFELKRAEIAEEAKVLRK